MADQIDQGGPDMLAGEYALRVLEGAELAEAQRRMLADPQFAADVAWWEDRLHNLSETVPGVTPSTGVLRAILARIEGEAGHQDRAPSPIAEARERRGPSRWSIATALAGLGAAAAAIALFVATPRTVVVPAPDQPVAQAGPVLIAQLTDEAGTMTLAGVVDPAQAKLSLSVRGLTARAGQSPELWVVPEGGAPVSLGLIPEGGSLTRELAPEERQLLRAGALLAVTFEDAATAPHPAPTTTIVLAGPLAEV